MNLIIDIGNTFIKAALFDQGQEPVEVFTFKHDDKGAIKKLFQYDVTACLISSVTEIPNEIRTLTKSISKTFFLEENQVIYPIKNNYETPETLGSDRLANACAAAHSFQDENVLVIDMGTCIKYDLVDKSGVYQGGSISAGIRMRYEALHEKTGKLPLLDTEFSESPLGKTTDQALHTGVMHAILFEMKGFVSFYKDSFNPLKVILTGGDAFYFEKLLKNSIFADSFLTLKGLNEILKVNVRK